MTMRELDTFLRAHTQTEKELFISNIVKASPEEMSKPRHITGNLLRSKHCCNQK